VAFVSTDSKIYRTSLARCGDPYCVWNTNSHMCETNKLVLGQAVPSK